MTSTRCSVPGGTLHEAWEIDSVKRRTVMRSPLALVPGMLANLR
ncbi:hypothetical protein ACFQZ4_11200 [Catellatospora coxensis]|nr:hypothetical protein [Catellatospora coxensis]